MYQFDPTISSAIEVTTAPGGPGTPASGPLSTELLARMDRYWRAAIYLTIGQIYVQDNPLLREP